MNQIIVKIILWLSPSPEKLLMVLLEYWIGQRCRANGERDHNNDPACNAADTLLDELESLERVKQSVTKKGD
jgi:hypothetical protein